MCRSRKSQGMGRGPKGLIRSDRGDTRTVDFSLKVVQDMSKTDGDDWGAGDWDAITEITPHLFVCGKCAINQTRLDKLGINLIINATRDLPNFVPNPAKDIRLIRVPVHDNVQESLAPYFQAVSNLIKANEENGGKTVVHCVCGVSRSVSLCIAYLMTTEKTQKKKLWKFSSSKRDFMGCYEALDFIKAKRTIACPNSAFIGQLAQFEKDQKSFSKNMLKNDEMNALKEIEELTEIIREKGRKLASV